MEYVIFNKTNGAIRKKVSCPSTLISLQFGKGEGVIESDCDFRQYYIDLTTETIVSKPEVPSEMDKSRIQADGVDTVTINNLPTSEPNGNNISSYVRVAGEEYEVTDGHFEFSTDTPRTYIFRCSGLNYLDKKFEVEAI